MQHRSVSPRHREEQPPNKIRALDPIIEDPAQQIRAALRQAVDGLAGLPRRPDEAPCVEWARAIARPPTNREEREEVRRAEFHLVLTLLKRGRHFERRDVSVARDGP